jgi:acetylornithine deacetylase/succinyl-diaminopimelate desuccinylase-like protein
MDRPLSNPDAPGPSWLEELSELLRIPSVSADPTHSGDVARAADWVCAFVRRVGGESAVLTRNGQPLVVGEVPASTAQPVPTVLLYGHFDVQPPDPLELWESAPFEPAVRDGTLYARGVADDKGHLYSLLKGVERLAAAGELPVRVRVACDGEEETGGRSIVDLITAGEVPADACLIYDSTLIEPGLAAFNVATRGFVYFHVRVRTGQTDLHSGMYGGAALNALHALQRVLAAVLPREGRVPEPLRVGVVPPTDAELADWAALPHGDEELAQRGANPADPRAAEEFHLRTFAEPSVDVHGIAGGSAGLLKTVLPVEATANVSIRIVSGQDPEQVAQAFERLLRDAAPEGAELDVQVLASTPPAVVDVQSTPVELALDAVEWVVGTRPLLVRWGASLPVVSALAGRGIPTVLTGFASPDCNMHAPNERMSLESIETAIAATQQILCAWGGLPSG